MRKKGRKNRNRRILDIYLRLAEGKMIYIKKEVEEFGVSVRTIKRDITEIRLALADHFDTTALVYVKKQNGYKLSEVKTNIMTSGVVLKVCRILMECEAFLENEIKSILDKLIKNCLLKEDQKLVWELIGNEWCEKTACKKLLYKGKWEDLVLDLEMAVKKQKVLKMTYQKVGVKKPVVFTVEPMAVLFFEGSFYLAAYIAEREQGFVRQEEPILYQVSRIVEIQVLESNYYLPYKKRFEEREFWKRMYSGEKVQVQLYYTGKRIEAIFDRLPSADIKEGKDGGYWIEVEVFEDEILKLVLSQGEDMEIVKPIELRDKLKEMLEQILKKYENNE